ncbi:DUF3572 domain-containing protein [Tranquillimonas alkanivorans]|uniref:DUF3572 domain-containing protein n=1 Tax=Tranquillimonas alkanivorans TaxID=441119 RepID=A0A1I5M1L6_9RHOB|nr:DUF3572 domain-containing protein [Tranquillimonas alkanivorans]SFP03494.1 Protein of unknown function [Tranquillimonas alkanivorans]
MKQEQAETIAAQALAWLASTGDLLSVFLGSSGMSVDDLRGAADSPEVLGAVLDFLCMDDAWVTTFCDQAGLDYEAPMRARQALPGGAQVHWT